MSQYWIIKMKHKMKISVLFTQWKKLSREGLIVIVVIQSLSWVQLFVAQWTPVCQVSLSFTNCQSLFKLRFFWCQLCHSTILSSVVPFSYSQSFPASGSFPMGQLFTSGGQSIGASASVCPMNIQTRFPSGLIGLISLQSKGLSRGFSSTTIWKHQFFSTQSSFWSNSHISTRLLEKP